MMDFPYILKQKKPNVGISKFDYTLYLYITDCFILETVHTLMKCRINSKLYYVSVHKNVLS